MAAPATKRQKEEVKLKIQSVLFEALEVDNSNYLEWSNDTKAYLAADELNGTLKEETAVAAPTASKWKALLMLRRHLGYWRQLKKCFLHEKTIYLPQARSN